MKELYAHSANSQGQKHSLVDHLKEVAALSRKYSDIFGAEDPAYYVGLWRDLGSLQKKPCIFPQQRLGLK